MLQIISADEDLKSSIYEVSNKYKLLKNSIINKAHAQHSMTNCLERQKIMHSPVHVYK